MERTGKVEGIGLVGLKVAKKPHGKQKPDRPDFGWHWNGKFEEDQDQDRDWD